MAGLYEVAGLDEALEVANDTPFGLSSNVWTRDSGEQERCARDLEAGGISFNGMTASHPGRRGATAVPFPFGGVNAPATAVSWPGTVSGSSATRRPCGTGPKPPEAASPGPFRRRAAQGLPCAAASWVTCGW